MSFNFQEFGGVSQLYEQPQSHIFFDLLWAAASATSSADTKQEPREPGPEATLGSGVTTDEHQFGIAGCYLHGLSHAGGRGRPLYQCGNTGIAEGELCGVQGRRLLLL